ncbi:hypothetical protein FA15DRAFT_607577, partial [Coprinopsis marcescibilis]
RYGCSPFFLLTGAEPVTPLDIQEATWLVEPPSGFTTTAELIGARAKSLAKHQDFVESVRQWVHADKRRRVEQYEIDHTKTIRSFKFKPGDLVLLRNSGIESSLDKKLKPRYTGPIIVLARNKGGAYIVSEMDGAVHQNATAAYRLIPYYPRKHIPLPDNVLELISINPTTFKKMVDSDETGEDFNFIGMPRSAGDNETLNEENDAKISDEE